MIIRSHGRTCYSIQSAQSLVLLGLPTEAPMSALKGNDYTAVVVSSAKDAEKAVASFPKAFIIASPGEYNISDCFVYGVAHNSDMLYSVAFTDDLAVGYVACDGHKEFAEGLIELLGSIDILMVFIDDKHGVSPDTAETIVGQIEPSFVLPMYDEQSAQHEELLNMFYKNLGQEKPKAETELKLKPGQLSGEVLEVGLLKPLE